MKTDSQLIEEYAERCVEDMDMDTLCVFVKETIENEMSCHSGAVIREQVAQFYPDLLDD